MWPRQPFAENFAPTEERGCADRLVDATIIEGGNDRFQSACMTQLAREVDDHSIDFDKRPSRGFSGWDFQDLQSVKRSGGSSLFKDVEKQLCLHRGGAYLGCSVCLVEHKCWGHWISLVTFHSKFFMFPASADVLNIKRNLLLTT